MSIVRIARLGVFAVAFIAPLACGGGGTIDWHRFVRPEDEEFARAFFDSVRFERVDYALGELSPLLAGMPGIRDSLVSMGRQLPHGPLDSVHLIGANRFTSSSTDRSDLTFEFHSASGWGAVEMVVLREDGPRVIHGFHADRLPRALEVTNAFTLRDKSFGHYLMIGLMVVCVVVAIGSAVLALFTPMKRRWAWALLALVGTGTFAFNWTTGQGRLMLLNLLFFDAGYWKGGPAAPWVLKVAFPIGALLTIRRVRSARHEPAAPTAPLAPPDPVAPIGSVTPLTETPNEGAER